MLWEIECAQAMIVWFKKGMEGWMESQLDESGSEVRWDTIQFPWFTTTSISIYYRVLSLSLEHQPILVESCLFVIVELKNNSS